MTFLVILVVLCVIPSALMIGVVLLVEWEPKKRTRDWLWFAFVGVNSLFIGSLYLWGVTSGYLQWHKSAVVYPWQAWLGGLLATGFAAACFGLAIRRWSRSQKGKRSSFGSDEAL
jgi:hypothetical protein